MIIAWTWWYRYYYHLDTRRNLWLSPWTWWYRLLSLTHAAIYDYRLEPGDIDIIIALTVYGLKPSINWNH
jgi:hypothetical protein